MIIGIECKNGKSMLEFLISPDLKNFGMKFEHKTLLVKQAEGKQT